MPRRCLLATDRWRPFSRLGMLPFRTAERRYLTRIGVRRDSFGLGGNCNKLSDTSHEIRRNRLASKRCPRRPPAVKEYARPRLSPATVPLQYRHHR